MPTLQMEPSLKPTLIVTCAARRCAMLGLSALTLAGAPLTVAHAMQAAPATAAAVIPSGPALPPITPLPNSLYTNEIPLYPSRILKGPAEQWEVYLGGPIVRNVINPTLTPLFPPAGKGNGTAVIYAPGGGFKYLGMKDPELQKLTDRGVTVFLLKYRLDPTDRDPRKFEVNLYKFLFDMVSKNQQPNVAAAGSTLHATEEALEDGLAAVRLVRSQAIRWGVDPKRVGFMGGSAGAMTALDVAFTTDDKARPDFIVAMIAPKRVDEVPATAPPLFAASSADDPLFPGTTENLVAAWSKAGRPVEAHFYEHGGHGLASGTTGDRWFEGLAAWMSQHGWLAAAK